tara:strand:- start:447733 stop:448155 length:423 start_codon:yes stop_codon:yes gene_type:complete
MLKFRFQFDLDDLPESTERFKFCVSEHAKNCCRVHSIHDGLVRYPSFTVRDLKVQNKQVEMVVVPGTWLHVFLIFVLTATSAWLIVAVWQGLSRSDPDWFFLIFPVIFGAFWSLWIVQNSRKLHKFFVSVAMQEIILICS